MRARAVPVGLGQARMPSVCTVPGLPAPGGVPAAGSHICLPAFQETGRTKAAGRRLRLDLTILALPVAGQGHKVTLVFSQNND
jgi:hypothetical protein